MIWSLRQTFYDDMTLASERDVFFRAEDVIGLSQSKYINGTRVDLRAGHTYHLTESLRTIRQKLKTDREETRIPDDGCHLPSEVIMEGWTIYDAETYLDDSQESLIVAELNPNVLNEKSANHFFDAIQAKIDSLDT